MRIRIASKIDQSGKSIPRDMCKRNFDPLICIRGVYKVRQTSIRPLVATLFAEKYGDVYISQIHEPLPGPLVGGDSAVEDGEACGIC